MPNISSDKLTEFAAHLLQAGGIEPEEAALIARSLVAANERGHDSHGVMRIPYYLDFLKKGDVVAGAKFTILKKLPSVLVTDGGWGFGQTQARKLMEHLIDMALVSGVAVGTMVHCSHIGRLGEYLEQAAEAGLVSMVMVNTHGVARRVAPPGGKEPRLGTNPLAIGVPSNDGPLLLDFGTSATAEGKVRVKKIAGQLCPDGWLLDCDGKPTNDPNKLYDNPPGSILPMGGDQAYKGFGLGLMVEILTGALSGGPCIREKPENQNGNCIFMLAINPEHFGGADHFNCEVTGLSQFVRSCPTIEGVQEILLPGDPERRVMSKRTATGIPFDEGNWNQLLKFAQELNVPAPTL